MQVAECCLLLLLLLLLTGASAAGHTWVVQVDSGHETARSVAEEHRLENRGKLPYLNNKFEFRLNERELKRDAEKSDAAEAEPLHHRIHRSLKRHPKVSWVAYQTELPRVKRDLVRMGPSGPRALSDYPSWRLNHRSSGIFKDPMWPQQWYLHDTRTSFQQPKVDLHVIPAWRQNLTGRGIVVAVVDDGLEIDHPDIAENFDAEASFDYNNDRKDPWPDYKKIEDSRHGTRCAGEIAMVANNSHCGVGVAFHARVGGVRILGGPVTDAIEAKGLTHALHKVHVYSCSWGPTDDGQTMMAPGPLAAEALEAAVRVGRGGKGSIMVWAAGNGGPFGDNCNCDGYATSIYTLTVSSASQKLKRPWYAERCSATIATTFSSGTERSGDRNDQLITSIDLQHKCTNQFSGTSASAPLASGIVALALQANPDLTWRDVQHAVIWTAEVSPLQHNRGWNRNGRGHFYHHSFGFGLFNTAALIHLVDTKTWKRVPEKTVEEFGDWSCDNGGHIDSSTPNVTCSVKVGTGTRIRYLEHVQLRMLMRHSARGSLSVTLVSPSGSPTHILTPRPSDTSDAGLDWTFMSVHLWGEQPEGNWQLKVADELHQPGKSGKIQHLKLILHGTEEAPHYRRFNGGHRQYNDMYNFVKNVQGARRSGQRERGGGGGGGS